MEKNILAQVWSEWEIEKQIGRGSFGAVYQAVRRDSNLTSHAAIKIISIPQYDSELESLRAEGMDLQATRSYLKEIVDEFINEIKVMEPFKGIQNIVSIEDYKVIEKKEQIGWDIYIRMELLTPFNTYICDKSLSEEEVIRLGIDICSALDICAQRNIIHRDIKPENIFVNSFGNFKLGDFGTARKMENLFGGLSQKGTYNYMAPEVISGMDYDARVDVYSLGLVLYRLMNGKRLPFLSEKQLLSPGERQGAFERRIRGEQLPPPCNASKELTDVILKACAYKAEDRFANAAQMRLALQQIGGGVFDYKQVVPPVDMSGKAEQNENLENKPKQNVVSDSGYVVDKGEFAGEKTAKKGETSNKILLYFAVGASLLALISAILMAVILGTGMMNPNNSVVLNEQSVVTETESEQETDTTVESTDEITEMVSVEEQAELESTETSEETIETSIEIAEESSISIAESSEPETQEPFVFENVTVMGTSVHYDGRNDGFNVKGEDVWWCVDVGFDLPEKTRKRYPPRITCSWSKDFQISAESLVVDTNFEAAKAGRTTTEFGYTPQEMSDTGVERFSFTLGLPDNPDIAGSQSATVQVGESELTVYFDLVYVGDYVNGTGWYVTNIYY